MPMLPIKDYISKVERCCKYCKKDIRNCRYGKRFIHYTDDGIALCSGFIRVSKRVVSTN
jgi:hypothetical protein